jgi:tRNA A-37 threonylcarbamoyl transferase component Bud32
MVENATSEDEVAKPLIQGCAEGADLFELIRMLVRTHKSGLLNILGVGARAEVYIDQGVLVAAFFNEISGAPAFTRAVLMGRATYQFEVHQGKFPRNLTQTTEYIIQSIETVLAQVGAELWSRNDNAPAGNAQEGDYQPSPAGTPAQPTEHDTLLISAFAPPETGRTIGKCKLEEEIGRGGSSIVYRARHATLDIPVVVKVLMQGNSEQTSHCTVSQNEAQLMARLNHPHVLRVFDYNDKGHYPHLIMEYVDGTSLAGLIQEQGSINIEQALPLFCQVTEGLAYAHSTLGMVHCDIKPSNILLTKGMMAKVADFGLAKITRMSETQLRARAAIKDHVAGTPAYIAPEQVEGGWDCATHRSDIYALGATFYHALTGHLPFEENDPVELMAKRLRFDPVPPHIVKNTIDRRLSDLVMLMLVRDPTHRIHTWADLLNALYGIADQIEEEGQEKSGDAKIIRRRTSFWSQVPSMLLRKSGPSEGGATQVG